ncbi:MAG: hypothetical protein AABY14_02885 [Nanoarchaeota archaeon]
MKLNKLTILYGIITVMIIVIIFFFITYSSQKNNLEKLGRYVNDLMLISGVGAFQDAHNHADISIYLNGKKLDLSQEQYQLRARHLHLENSEGEVIHTHASGITIGHFLNSLGFRLTNSCLKTNFGIFCDNENSKLKFYVNGKPNDEFSAYVIKDLDKILISYGTENESELQVQIKSITDFSKKYSNTRMGDS